MGRPDVGDHPHRRLCNLAQIAHATAFANAHFDHRHVVVCRQLTKRERQAQAVIAIALRRQNPVPRAQHRGYHILRGGLAIAPGNADHRNVEPPAIRPRQIAQGQVRRLDCDHVSRGVTPLPADHRRARALFKCRVDKLPTVHPRSGQGKKNVARRERARIDAHPRGHDSSGIACALPAALHRADHV